MGMKSILVALHKAWAGDPRIPPGAQIGKDVYPGRGVILDWGFGHLITIEDEVTIVTGARILCHDAASNRRLGVTWCAPVTIGRRAFIGADALIMPGVTIGRDAVVAARAVVTKDVASGAVVAGVPASTISSSLEMDRRREELLKTRRTFGPEFAGNHLPQSRKRILRAAGLEGGYFIRMVARGSARGEVCQMTDDPPPRL